MKAKYVLVPIILVLGLSGCSIQLNGLNGAYKDPISTQSADIATLQYSPDDFTIISIDGQSFSRLANNSFIALSPGQHTITLYMGKNNYISEKNNMIVLTASFQKNEVYYFKTANNQVWIQNAQGAKVSSVDSSMNFSKSIEL